MIVTDASKLGFQILKLSAGIFLSGSSESPSAPALPYKVKGAFFCRRISHILSDKMIRNVCPQIFII